MDPDRYQMRDLKRRVTRLEKSLEGEKKHVERLGKRIAGLRIQLEEDHNEWNRQIEVLRTVVGEIHARFPRDLWEA